VSTPAQASYERIHYGLRPAKNVQRKMLVEALRRLSEFGSLSSYRYIGFGSTYFSDFSLFHKALGIRQMISIERDVSNKKRFEFNRPFSCIQMSFGESSNVLPSLKWNVKTILWLDYDGPLAPSMLSDVKFFCASAVSGSLLIVTVNAEPSGLQENKTRLEELVESLGRECVPPDVKERDLSDWGKARVCRRILNAEILETLSARNGAQPEESKVRYKQLFNFHYKDGDKMLTVGGLLYEGGQDGILAKCGFDQLEYIRSSMKADCAPFLIQVPMLTYREIRHLDKQLPRNKHARLSLPKVSRGDVKNYENIYRYFPTFAETEV
jgi:Putative O-methyltransferase